MNVHEIRSNDGAAQKIGLRAAIRNGSDIVIVSDPNKNLSPDIVAMTLRPFENASVGCVLGVPLHRSLEGRWATFLNNRLAGVQLKEWNPPVRAFRVSALSKIPFALNTNDDHFNTEILLQAVNVGIPFEEVEVTLPARSFSFVSSIKASLKFFLQKYHLFYDVRFHPDELKEKQVYVEKMESLSPHSLVCLDEQLVPAGSRVLDIGCARGYVASFLAQKKKCDVVGVDRMAKEDVPHPTFRYEQIDVETQADRLIQLLDQNEFDVVLMLDVLEHLSSPEQFLLRLSQRDGKKSFKFVCSTGNVAFFVIRVMLLFGHFNYGRKGILDITHKRLFSLHTFRNLLTQTGFLVEREHFIPFPFKELGWSSGFGRFMERLNKVLIKIRPRLFAYQILFETRPLSS